jgi:hypothetical protein
MPATERVYRTIGGVQLRYVRISPVVAPYYARSTSEFEDKLDRFSYNLAFAPPAWYGRLRWIGTAGAYVNKPGYHGLGRAFDLDIVQWRHAACRPLRGHHAGSRLAHRRRYIAVDALARRWFKYVLDAWYNAAHRDHLHLDDGGGALVFNPGYRSDTVFIQRAANVMIGANLAIDGIYGPRTDAAFHRMKRRADVPHRVSSSPRVYRRFLWRLAIQALRNRPL